ncbi:hypothetical protein HDU88_008597 [Geranomyces variabilis]|nr:hypothetical protein HDU88_008597 [Geranomyces variabilis]
MTRLISLQHAVAAVARSGRGRPRCCRCMSTPRPPSSPLPSFAQFAQSLAAAGVRPPAPSSAPQQDIQADPGFIAGGSENIRQTHFIPGKFLDILREDTSEQPAAAPAAAARNLARSHAPDLRNLDPTENLTGPRKKLGRLAEKIHAAVTDILFANPGDESLFGSDLSPLADAIEVTSVLPSASGKTFYICFRVTGGGATKLSSREIDSLLQMYEIPLRKMAAQRVRNASGAWFPSLKFLRDAHAEKRREIEDLLDQVQREMEESEVASEKRRM